MEPLVLFNYCNYLIETQFGRIKFLHCPNFLLATEPTPPRGSRQWGPPSVSRWGGSLNSEHISVSFIHCTPLPCLEIHTMRRKQRPLFLTCLCSYILTLDEEMFKEGSLEVGMRESRGKTVSIKKQGLVARIESTWECATSFFIVWL